MKRFLQFILLSAMILSVFSACTSSNSPQLIDFIGEDVWSVDLKGDTVRLVQDLDLKIGVLEHLYDTPMYDAIMTRIKYLETKYNCDIEIYSTENADRYKTYVTNCLSTGVVPGDILYGHGMSIMSTFAYADFLYPLDQLKEYLDYENSEKFGTAGILEGAMKNGIPYAVQPVQWLGFENNFCYLIAYNTDLFAQYNFTDLHEFTKTKHGLGMLMKIFSSNLIMTEAKIFI